MWIRSQNRKELVHCVSFSVSKNIGGKKKNAVIGMIADGMKGRKEILLGLYDTEEIATNELTKIQHVLANNTKVYEMD